MPPPTLPPELWGHIFTFVDDFDLWWNCRKICSIIRLEAEREFALHRLCSLRLTWDTLPPVAANGDKYSGRLQTKGWLAKFSPDGSRVFFHFAMWCGIRAGNATGPFGFTTLSLDEVHRRNSGMWAAMAADLSYRSVDALLKRYFLPNRELTLGDITHEVELAGLEIDFSARILSFEWKKALTLFYLPDAYYRNMMKRDALIVLGDAADSEGQMREYELWRRAYLTQVCVALSLQGFQRDPESTQIGNGIEHFPLTWARHAIFMTAEWLSWRRENKAWEERRCWEETATNYEADMVRVMKEQEREILDRLRKETAVYGGY